MNSAADLPAPRSLPLWLCADLAADADAPALAARVRAVLDATPACVWLRAARPDAVTARALLALARELAVYARARGGALLVGDRVDIALAAGADGVHLGGRAVSPADARRVATLSGRDALFVSAAVHDAEQIRAARSESDALVLSPFESVPGKGPRLGPERFAALVAEAPAAAFVALGGIVAPAPAAAAARAGARAIAVRRALLESPAPAALACALRDAFLAARAEARERDVRRP